MENATEESLIVPNPTSKTKPICSKAKKPCFVICTIIGFIGLIAWLTVWIQWMDGSRQNELWLKKILITTKLKILTPLE